ncbi:MAG: alpha-2-macroglobulin family protein [Crocinitomicaceae bacterium]|nr:alpha-2-macroglobulin family protein [Crocinitomicaceae bacterium]
MIRSILYTTVLFALSLVLMSQSCEKNEDKSEEVATTESVQPEKEEMEMLKYTFAESYVDLWANVDSLEREGLYKSALDVVNTIFSKAQSDENAPQIVKSVIFRMKYNSYLEEDDFIKAIAELNSLSEGEEFPIKQLIHSVTAEVYWQYYQSNRWTFMNRSQTVNFENDDVRTWDLKKISEHVNKHFLLSLESADSSQHANLSDFRDVLSQTNTERSLRPTLYDFLAHRAISFFSNAESELVRPEAKFVIDSETFFGSSEEFVNFDPVSQTGTSNTFMAVKTYQKLTRFRIDDKKVAPLIDLEINRLKFMRSNSVSPNKDELYLSALKALVTKYAGNEATAEVQYYIAQYYSQQGNQYTVDMPETRWDKKKALTLCKLTMKEFPDSYGASLCKELANGIKMKSLSSENEIAYAKGENGRVKISYRNVDSVFVRIIKVPNDFYVNERYYGREIIDEISKFSINKERVVVLENPGDYQDHSTEIVLNEKEYGQYAVLISPSKSFSKKNNIILHDSYWVTDLAYTHTVNSDYSHSVYVTDRSTGEPLNRIKVELFERKYNYSTDEYEIKLRETLRTDLSGRLTINPKTKYRNYLLQLSNGQDVFNTGNDVSQSGKRRNRTSTETTTFFYLDRGIYRPGQKIYFKGIKIKKSGERNTLVTNSSSKVVLYDVNYQKVAELNLKTNEYGTFSGSFTAPNSGLNGSMHIQDGDDAKYFSVEEYKRPKFEVEFAPVEGSFKIGERIKVKGNAKAYAGSNIDGADVQFRVTRSSYFNPWTYYRWGYYPPQASPIEIKNGVLKTDENGEFTVEFDALEDPTINKKFSPRYSYEIHADVTDLNGETRSGSQWVSVGYNCLNLNLNINEIVERSSSNKFKVSTTNLNGQKTPAQGTVKVVELIEPDQVFRQQFWERPDLPMISEKEHRKLFPHDVYADEDEVKNFKKGKQILVQKFDTEKSDSVEFTEMNTWKPGRYMVEAKSIDAFGEVVEEVQYITILDKSSKENAISKTWKMTPIKVVCEPGETAEILISTAAEDMSILYEVELRGKIVSKDILKLSKGQKSVKIPVREEHRGNFTVTFTSVKYGRLNSTKQMIIVPYSNKRLDISFETFRNKLIPGSPEEWKLVIKGPNGAKVASELMATMYDASLDEFASNNFYLNPYQSRYSYRYYSSYSFNNSQARTYSESWNASYYAPRRSYDQLNWWGFDGYGGYGGYRYYQMDMVATGSTMGARSDKDIVYSLADAAESEESPPAPPTEGTFAFNSISANQEQTRGGEEYKRTESGGGGADENGLGKVKARTNLNETAFFYPQMETNSKGEIILKFTAPEALTRWKFLGLAHTKDLKVGTIQEEVVTQKELMVMPNAPRFFREGDQMTFTSKVSNLSETDLNGSAQLMLFDATTMQPIDDEFKNLNATISFTAKKGQSAKLAWAIEVPFGISAVIYRVVAKAGAYSDGEEMALPVLSNRMLVTESLPLPSKGIGTKDFTFTKLVNIESSTSLKHHRLTLEYTSNPAWYAVQAMPYMMEFPHECAEQTFTRYYANSLASSIVNSSPKIKEVFEQWKESSPDAFLSNLEKNQELKSVMLQETPWVLDAKNESERKKRVALLFDLNKMDNQLNKALRKLENMQVSNGAWPWFPGMRENRHLTQHIVTGMGHLDHLGVKSVREDRRAWNMVKKAVAYLDRQVVKDYEWTKSHDADYKTNQHINQTTIQYLYARSYFKDLPMDKNLQEAFDYYQDQANTYWLKFNIYSQGMIALQAKRYEIETLPTKITRSLKERSIVNEELGMYWKSNSSGYYWYQAPIETQAMMIEAFDEVANDQEAVEELKVWLLKQKQTTDWKTTKATAEACYALLLRGTDLLENDEQVAVKVNGKLIDPEDKEAGTGYFKKSWGPEEIKPEMGNVSVTRTTEGVSWGAMYWQYFEDLDKITHAETPLKLEQKLFLVQNTDNGPVITPIDEGTKLKPGDKVRVRIELRTDRNMEYVHMKDMRAAGFEPTNVISRYKWQDGLGYYESTGDAATNFFMDYLPKGVYVFEYDLRVSHEGDFSNGITTIQCMYAPEFTSHSDGVRVNVGE